MWSTAWGRAAKAYEGRLTDTADGDLATGRRLTARMVRAQIRCVSAFRRESEQRLARYLHLRPADNLAVH